MADKGVAHLNTSIFEDEVKSALGGNLAFDCATAATGTHKWVYSRKAITGSTAIFTADNDYTDGVALHTSDIAKYIAIKHSGTTDGTNTTTDGLMIGLEGTNTYNTAHNIFLEPGEMVILKCPYLTIANLEAISVVIVNGKPSANSTASVYVLAAGILDDVA
tara:strand:+ start:2534 stop:3019 length:486 start_codon:yes stop_codon:yes gene_type:complete